MAKRAKNRLTDRTLPKRPGFYPDGDGLYLQVADSGARSWIFRFKVRGRQRFMGLGPVGDVGLAAARELAADARKLKRQGIDPIDARDARMTAERQQSALDAAKLVTFRECTTAFIDAHKAGWRNPKHRQQWENTLKTYAWPIVGDLPVREIDTGLVLKVLEPQWRLKTETMSRVRGRIEKILDWAKVRGYRSGENPALWRGHLDNQLARPSKIRKVRHHPALPYSDIGEFMKQVRGQAGLTARALEFAILTATRTSEIIGVKWSEIELEKKVWTVPANRIKAEREHRVPLSDRSAALLKKLLPFRRADDYVFPASKKGKHLSNGAMLMLLERMGRGDITVHGFRSTFKDWATECTGFPAEASEMALAHVVKDKTEAAYRRGDLFEKRRKLMDAWAAYCAKADGGKVVAIDEAKRQREGARP